MVADSQRHAPAALSPLPGERIRTVQEAGRAPGPVWTGAKNLFTTGIRSPDRPASHYTDWAIPAHSLDKRNL
jgi:hypothetical protein